VGAEQWVCHSQVVEVNCAVVVGARNIPATNKDIRIVIFFIRKIIGK
jgi:hypothetical protein